MPVAMPQLRETVVWNNYGITQHLRTCSALSSRTHSSFQMCFATWRARTPSCSPSLIRILMGLLPCLTSQLFSLLLLQGEGPELPRLVRQRLVHQRLVRQHGR